MQAAMIWVALLVVGKLTGARMPPTEAPSITGRKKAS
jgi:hypothetical protein